MCLKEFITFAFIFFMFLQVRSQVCFTSMLVDNNSGPKSAEIVAVIKCCKGYRKLNENSVASNTNCVWSDSCENVCKYGRCSPTNECICYKSYEIYPPGSNTCVPKCDVGYKRVDGVCRPHCSKPCAPRTCFAPERCSCDNEWKVNDQGHCVSMCHPKCGNGTCVGWNKCECWAGYRWNKNENPQCAPFTNEAISESRNSSSTSNPESREENKEIAKNGTTTLVGSDANIKTEQPCDEKSIQINSNWLSPHFLYASCGLNIILLLIIAVKFLKNPSLLKCRKVKDKSNNETQRQTTESNNESYVVMQAHANNIITNPQAVKDEANNAGGDENSFCYDYVPVSYNQRHQDTP